jgi:hypothetical protein
VGRYRLFLFLLSKPKPVTTLTGFSINGADLSYTESATAVRHICVTVGRNTCTQAVPRHRRYLGTGGT